MCVHSLINSKNKRWLLLAGGVIYLDELRLVSITKGMASRSPIANISVTFSISLLVFAPVFISSSIRLCRIFL